MSKKFFTILIFSLLAFLGLAQENPLWMRYPAISPDGQYIAFEYKGNIWKVSVNGGEAIPLTIHPGYEFRPVWSPDGKYIAFASDRSGNFDIYIMPSDGGKATRLTYYSGNEYPYAFSPDAKYIYYATSFQKAPESMQFPNVFTELYKISTDGKEFSQVLSTTAELVSFFDDGKRFVYQDKKGYENYWRKHHRSSVTRDIWLYDQSTGQHTKLTQFNGEDRNPVVAPDQKTIYYLTEEFNNNLNVAKFSVDNPSQKVQLTKFEKNPVRFLSVAKNGTICFGYRGEIYTMKDGSQPKKVNITVKYDGLEPDAKYKVFTSSADEMAVSPDGKYVAFTVRGDVFVTSVSSSETRRITDTPGEERNVSFSPDGKALIYASERDGSWNIYQSKIKDKDQKSFLLAKQIVEEPVVATSAEEFQPKYSPGGDEVAYLENRTTLKVINLKTKKTRTVLPGNYNYSYSDGDQWFDWSPDGKWLLVTYSPFMLFSNEVGLVDASGTGKVINLTQSGYEDNRPKWMLDGKMMIWLTDRQGYRSHGSWGSEYDVYAMFFDQETYDTYQMTDEEYKAWKENKKKDKDNGENKDDGKKKKSKKDDDKTNKKEPLKLDLNNLDDRTMRLTINSAKISDAVMSPDGEKLYYLAKFEKGYDLWVHDLRKHQTKLITKLSGRGHSLTFDKDGKNLFLIANGKIMKINVSSGSKDYVSFRAEKKIDYYAEKAYLFDHVWRLMKEKFYDPDMHGVDWNYYRQEYSRYLPYINNNYDFSEMLSEMLGELNASHTGSGYRPNNDGDRTARLGLIYDLTYTGKGLKVAEVLEKGPFFNAKTKIKPGIIIDKIDGTEIESFQHAMSLLNRKADKFTVVGLYDPKTKKHWEETVNPISRYEESELLYKRWVKRERELTYKLSSNTIGYVHVRGMNSSSYRQVYSDALGKEYDKKALVVDTRFNGGGWLHDDLATFLSGKKYVEYWPHGRYFGYDPMSKWVKPSAVLISEANYSDAHGFPYTYKTLKIGKLVGMPIAGTMTAVWWETLMDPTLYFGIPQVGVKDLSGHYLENHQLEPDVKIWNDYDKIINGQDQQLKAAVELLMKEAGK